MRLLAMILTAWAMLAPALAAPTQHDGRWQVTLRCAALPGLPPQVEQFEVAIRNGLGSASVPRTLRDGEQVTERWSFRLDTPEASAVRAVQAPRGANVLHLAGRAEAPGRVVLNGSFTPPVGNLPPRDCQAVMTRAQPPAPGAVQAAGQGVAQVAAAPAPAAASVAPTPVAVPIANPNQRRVALVIGNQDYRKVPKLQNAAADARAMAAALKDRGFQVIEGYDLDRSQMNRAFNRFEATLSAGAVAVLYFAGHGVQIGGTNVLVPVDMNPENERDLIDDGLPLPPLMERMAGVNGRRDGGLNLLIIDACRNNPFRATGRALGASRGLAAGGASGAMVLYAAASNQEALDRLGPQDQDPNGLFTRTLLKEMATPGLPVREMVAKVRSAVAAAARSVGAEQTPAVYDEAEGDFVFTPGAARAQALSVPAQPVAAPSPGSGPDREGQFWDSIRASQNPADFEAYLQAYPNGAFAALARNRLATLRPAAAPAGTGTERGLGGDRGMALTNGTGAPIVTLYFGPSSRNGDSPNHGPLPPGRTAMLRLPPGDCSYDLYLAFAPEARRGDQFHRGVDTCARSALTLQ